MRGLALLLATACTRAEYRCHHNINQDYCAKVSSFRRSARSLLLLLLLACSLCRSPSRICDRICPPALLPPLRSGSAPALTAAALLHCSARRAKPRRAAGIAAAALASASRTTTRARSAPRR